MIAEILKATTVATKETVKPMTQAQLLARADKFMKSELGLTPSMIRSGFLNEGNEERGAFLKVSLWGTDESGRFANVYFNDNGRVNFSLNKGQDKTSVSKDAFVENMKSLSIKEATQF